MKHRSIRLCCTLGAVVFCVIGVRENVSAQHPKSTKSLSVEKVNEPAGWNVMVGDKLFVGYRTNVSGTPVLYPVHGPNAVAMTRNFPMKKGVAGEKPDHDHHRSMWLTHGDVNGVDFWIDDKGSGRIVLTSGKATVDEKTGNVVIVTNNDWIGPDDKKLLSDTRRFEFVVQDDVRLIDCDCLLKASYGDVRFGDTKEGSFGVRLASTIKVDAKKGGKITNDSGQNNKGAWGKKSAWVDYSGPVGDQTVGMTIHCHPSSFGYPTRWHVRTYGLFAANPFGVHHFEGGEAHRGIVLKEDSKMRLNYRVVLHSGDFDKDSTAAASKAYENDPRPELE